MEVKTKPKVRLVRTDERLCCGCSVWESGAAKESDYECSSHDVRCVTAGGTFVIKHVGEHPSTR